MGLNEISGLRVSRCPGAMRHSILEIELTGKKRIQYEWSYELPESRMSQGK